MIVQSLWVGPKLSDLEKYSIKSFQKQGHIRFIYIWESWVYLKTQLLRMVMK